MLKKLTPLSILAFLVALSMSGDGAVVAAFQTRAIIGGNSGTSTCSTSSSCLHALSRRELFSAVPAATTAAAAATIFSGAVGAAPSAAFAAGTKKSKTEVSDPALLAYQGVYMDPNHPKGYRVLVGKQQAATMQLQDDTSGSEVYNLPVKISKDKKTQEVKLTFDFSSKGGPKNIEAVLGTSDNNKSGTTTTTLVFPDGNVWKKETGMIGVYRDGFDASKIRVIRKDKGSKFTVDLIQSPTETITLSAKTRKPKLLFDFPGKPNDPGTFNPTENTLSFGDGNVWTKF